MSEFLTLDDWENRMSDALSRFKLLFSNRQLDIPFDYFRNLYGLSQHFTRKNVQEHFLKLRPPSPSLLLYYASVRDRHGNVDILRPDNFLQWQSYCKRHAIPMRLLDVLYLSAWRFLAERGMNDLSFEESGYMLAILKAIVDADENPANAVARFIMWERICVSTCPRAGLSFIQNAIAYVVFWYMLKPNDSISMCNFYEVDNTASALYALFFVNIEPGVPFPVRFTPEFLRSIDAIASVSADGLRLINGTPTTVAKAVALMLSRPAIVTMATIISKPPAKRTLPKDAPPVVPEEDLMELLSSKRVKKEPE